MASRRTVLIGIGAAVAGGGALFATGAFTTVEAQRTVDISTAGDAAADLGIEVNEDYGEETDDGEAAIDLGGGDGGGLNPSMYFGYPPVIAIMNNTGLGALEVDISVADHDELTIIDEWDEGDTAAPEGELGFRFNHVDDFDGTEDAFENAGDMDLAESPDSVGDGDAALWELEVLTPPGFDEYEDLSLEIVIEANTTE